MVNREILWWMGHSYRSAEAMVEFAKAYPQRLARDPHWYTYQRDRERLVLLNLREKTAMNAQDQIWFEYMRLHAGLQVRRYRLKDIDEKDFFAACDRLREIRDTKLRILKAKSVWRDSSWVKRSA